MHALDSLMLLVPTQLKTSRIEGIGMFAVDDILPGTKIWEYKEGFDLVFMPEDLMKMPCWQAQYLEKYCFMFEQKLYFCVDDARYMNHSESPNSIDRIDGTYAIRDIKVGEEITCDYHKMGATEEDKEFNVGWMYHQSKNDQPGFMIKTE